jgi:hypothetical protein
VNPVCASRLSACYPFDLAKLVCAKSPVNNYAIEQQRVEHIRRTGRTS